MTEERNRALARMHLDLAQALFEQRGKLRMSLEELSQETGLISERTEMIEEGDATSLTEIAQLTAALGVALFLRDGFITLVRDPWGAGHLVSLQSHFLVVGQRRALSLG